jgi:hypothetical protein
VRLMETAPPSSASPAKREAIWRRVFDWVRPTRPLRFGTLLLEAGVTAKSVSGSHRKTYGVIACSRPSVLVTLTNCLFVWQ